MPGHDLFVPSGNLVIPSERNDLDAAVDAFVASAKSAATSHHPPRLSLRRPRLPRLCGGQGAAPVATKPGTVSRYVANLVARGPQHIA